MKEFDAKIFAALCEKHGIPRPVLEYRFHPTRKWRFDFSWPDRKVALEVEGGAFSGGRHTRGAGYLKDCRKYTEANLLGWCIIRVPPAQLHAALTIEWVALASFTRTCLAPDAAGQEPAITHDAALARRLIGKSSASRIQKASGLRIAGRTTKIPKSAGQSRARSTAKTRSPRNATQLDG